MTTRRKDTDTAPRGHENTWGATEAFKEQWIDKNAETVRSTVEKENEAKERETHG